MKRKIISLLLALVLLVSVMPTALAAEGSFTDITDENRGVALLSRGISEYDARENGDVYFTLLRCVGHLSKDTNGERSYCNAGPEYATPAAQELGPHTIDYALFFHDGKNPLAALRASDEFYAGLRCMQGEKYEGTLPARGSYLQLSGESLLLSAIKQAETGRGWVVRLYNAAERPVQGSLSAIRPIARAFAANLNEEPAQSLPCTDGTVTFTAEAHRIVTIIIDFDEETK